MSDKPSLTTNRPITVTTKDTSPAADATADPPPREDVEELCVYLADRIEENGARRPTITVEWRKQARLLLDRDGRTFRQARNMIDWCQSDTFWRSNILSMPKLREQYDRMKLQAERAAPGRADRPTVNGRVLSTGETRALQAIEAGKRVAALRSQQTRQTTTAPLQIGAP